MCTGLEIGALAGAGGAGAASSAILPGLMMSLAGTAINHNIQSNYTKAINSENNKLMAREGAARDAEMNRQHSFEADQASAVMDALEKANPATMRLQADEDAAHSEHLAAAEEYNVPTLQGQIVDGETGEGIGKIVGEALNRTKNILKAQATLSSQGTGFSSLTDALGRMSAEINTIGSNRRGSMGASQLETNIRPAQVTPSQSILGDALLMAGQAAAGASGKKAGLAPKSTPLSPGPFWQGVY